MTKRLVLLAVTLIAVVIASAVFLVRPAPVRASDHDDGETDVKTRNLNLTDMYVFREGDQTGNNGDNVNLIVALNCNPRSLPRQQYFFNQKARYEIHFGQQTASNARATGNDNIILRYTFSAPQFNNKGQAFQQGIQLSRVNVVNGVPNEAGAVTVNAGTTTPEPPGVGTGTPRNGNTAPVFNGDSAPVVTPVQIDGQTLTVFAGLREDPFFFDVTQYFRVRASQLGTGPPVNAFRSNTGALDFTKDYNVLSIVTRVPIAFLQQGNANFNTFDVFSVITTPQ